MAPINSDTRSMPRWVTYCAVGTVCAALPLLVLGAEVTTKKVGMVDQKGFRAPWHLFTVIAEKLTNGEPLEVGFVIEHSHRVAGFLVGIGAIVLAAGLWFGQRHGWLRWLGVIALAAVVAQGLLGIYRVNMNVALGNELKLIHGCFAQLVFALLVSVALFTSRSRSQPLEAEIDAAKARRLRRFALGTCCLIYFQLIFGGLVRHWDVPYGARIHLLLAFGVVAHVVWLLKLSSDIPAGQRGCSFSVKLLLGLVMVQLILGVESWLSRFPSPLWNQAQPLPVHPDLFRTLHYFVGSLIFANSVVVTLQAFRQAGLAVARERSPVGQLEGVL